MVCAQRLDPERRHTCIRDLLHQCLQGSIDGFGSERAGLIKVMQDGKPPVAFLNDLTRLVWLLFGRGNLELLQWLADLPDVIAGTEHPPGVFFEYYDLNRERLIRRNDNFRH